MTKENVIPMQFLSASCNFPKEKRSTWNPGWGLSLNPLPCPSQVSPDPLSLGEKPSLLQAPPPFIGAPWLELSHPFFLGVTWLNISISLVPWATKLWASILGELCLCQGKWVISEVNWEFKVPFFPTRRLGWIFQISFFFSDQVLGEPCVS